MNFSHYVNNINLVMILQPKLFNYKALRRAFDKNKSLVYIGTRSPVILGAHVLKGRVTKALSDMSPPDQAMFLIMEV